MDLPRAVVVQGVEYPVNSDFRCLMRLETLLESEHRPHAKIFEALRLFYAKLWPRDISAALQAMMDFYRGGYPAKKSTGKAERLYSFEHDKPYIYAAFLQQYGVDLCDIEYLHWYKFLALFAALGEPTQFARILRYRGADLQGMSKETQAEYLRMRKIFALPKNQEEERLDREIEEILLRGGDPSAVLEKN